VKVVEVVDDMIVFYWNKFFVVELSDVLDDLWVVECGGVFCVVMGELVVVVEDVDWVVVIVLVVGC